MARYPTDTTTRQLYRATGLILALAALGFQSQALASVQSCRSFSEKGVHASALLACSAVINRSQVRTATLATALFYRANSRYSTRDTTGALEDINRSLDLRPDFVPALSLRAAIRTQAGDTKGASADLDRAIASDLNNAGLLSRRATLRLSAGNLTGAAEDLLEVVAGSPHDAISYLRLATVLNELGRNKSALDAANRAVDLNRKNTDAYGVRAKIRSDSGDLDGALEDYSRAQTGAENGVRYLVGKADILARTGRPAKALEAIDTALGIDPTHRVALLLKADILQAQGETAGARSALGQVARTDPVFAVRNARLALSSGKMDAAVADYSIAITLDPALTTAYYERGQAYARTGKWAEAVADFDTVMAAADNFEFSRLNYFRGKARYRSGDLEGAVADLSAAILIDDTANERLWRALAYTDLGEFDLALKDAQKLVALAPRQARSHAVLGDVLLKSGRLAAGKISHEKALSIDPEFAPSRLRLEELGASE